ncbi:MAG: hypothetical protein ACREPR_00850 [Brasilonema sp.]
MKDISHTQLTLDFWRQNWYVLAKQLVIAAANQVKKEAFITLSFRFRLNLNSGKSVDNYIIFFLPNLNFRFLLPKLQIFFLAWTFTKIFTDY